MARVLDEEEEKKVCVTGGSGYIASWIVKLLLDRGNVVHATVRSLDDPRKTEHLRGLEGAKERLHLFEANLLEEGSFDAVVDGCCGVFHTASPIPMETSNPQADLIDPALKGTLNVLSSCAKAASVKRVIFTSSTAAVLCTGRPITSETVVDETWFSTPEHCKGFVGEEYVLSKTLAETATWKFAEENGIDMVSINPALVIGPMLQPVINWSSEVLFNLVNDDPRKTEHLRGLGGANERLQLFEANLLEEGSFDSAVDGCCGVFHTASPVLMETSNPQADLIDPALKGTLNVLSSCAKAPSVKRVIFTSSTAAVMYNARPVTPETVVDETWFSTPEHCKGFVEEEYVLSKTLAETAAWKFAEENGIDMVSINPALVIGPMLQPVINWSSDVLFNLVNGKSDTYLNSSFGWVHVKDVAEAHIKAFEIPLANGRYILSETVAHFSEIVDILKQLYPNLKLPHKCVDDEPFKPTYQISKDKVKSLGIEYIPLRVALKEAVDFLIEKKLINV